MAGLPANVGTGIVRISLRKVVLDKSVSPAVPEVLPAVGKVRFTPSTPTLINVVNGLLIPTTPVSVHLDGNGDAVVTLVATDDTDNNPVDWTYTVSFELDSGEIAPFSLSVAEGSDVELSDVTPVPDSNGTYYLTGPPGADGASGGSAVSTFTPGYYYFLNPGKAKSSVLTIIQEHFITPFFFPAAATWQSFTVEVTTASAGHSVWMAWYTLNESTGVMTKISDIGSGFSTTSLGVVTVSGLSIAIPQGPVWLAFSGSSGSAAHLTVNDSNLPFSGPMPNFNVAPTGTGGGWFMGGSYVVRLTTGPTAGVWPASYTIPAALSGNVNGNNKEVPMIVGRVAS